MPEQMRLSTFLAHRGKLELAIDLFDTLLSSADVGPGRRAFIHDMLSNVYIEVTPPIHPTTEGMGQ